MKKIFLLIAIILIANIVVAQNVGISNPTPTEKLHVDSGSIKIGKLVWNASNPLQFLKFGDGDYITLGEEEADDKLTIRAKELFIRPSGSYTSVPVSIKGSSYFSHFFFGTNEDTYLRGGKNTSNVNIADLGGRVGIGISNPTRAALEQNGSVGATSAIFGGSGTGISLQQNWPAIGFNSYLDGAGHKAIGGGFGAQMGLDQTTGALYLASFYPYNAAPNTTFGNFSKRFYISRFGKIGIGTDDPQSDLHIVQQTNTSSSGIQLQYSSVNNTSIWSIYTQTGTFLSNGNFYGNPLFFENNGGGFAAIGSNGSYFQSSDITLKKDIHYLSSDNYMAKIMQLKPASYHYKKEELNSPLNIGFIAQEIEKIFPEFVLTTNKGLKMVSYSSFIPILTKGIQEQQQQINDLQKENMNLKIRLEKLEKMIQNK
jgi:Chaperone of endosialidase